MIGGLDGEKPGHFLRPHKKSNSDRLRSAANNRAREGFKYWVLEKPVSKGQFSIALECFSQFLSEALEKYMYDIPVLGILIHTYVHVDN